MNPEQKLYIDSNVGKKSVGQIAAELGLKEKEVRRYLENRPARPAAEEASANTIAARKKINPLYIALLIIAIFVFYANSIGGPYLFDDKILLENNPLIRHISGAFKFFTTDIFCDRTTLKPVSNSYRPLQMINYAIDIRLFGDRSATFHLTAVFLHIVNALLILLILNRLFKNRFVSFVAAMWFGINPVNTQAVSYAAGRADLLVSSFMLISLILYVDFVQKKQARFVILSALSYLAALYSKEYALLTLPLILLVYNATFNRKDLLNLRHYACYAAAAVFYTVTRWALFHGIAMRDLELSRLPLFARFFTSVKTLFIDIRIIFFPHDLHFGRTTAVESSVFGSPASFMTFLGVLLLIGVIVFAYKKWEGGRRPGSGMIFFGLAWFLATMAPLLNIYPLQSFLIDSWLYLPSVGIYLIAGLGLDRLKGFAQKAGAVYGTVFYLFLTAIFLCYGLATVERNKDYRDEMRFYLSNVKWRPIVKFYNLAGGVCMQKKDYSGAIKYFKKALEANDIYPSADVVKTYFELGRAYISVSDYTKAQKAFEKVALSNNPDDEPMRKAALADLERIKQVSAR
jgi:tetratricopeptide (TPR) repeat protein